MIITICLFSWLLDNKVHDISFYLVKVYSLQQTEIKISSSWYNSNYTICFWKLISSFKCDTSTRQQHTTIWTNFWQKLFFFFDLTMMRYSFTELACWFRSVSSYMSRHAMFSCTAGYNNKVNLLKKFVHALHVLYYVDKSVFFYNVKCTKSNKEEKFFTQISERKL